MFSSEDEEEFVKYGTPLDPIEEDEIPRKRPCYREDQIVTDKQGRRRFHGAFTGGFSAGFFNTVGSLEGWKPSNFLSSKSEKQTLPQQKPEDYMDEEDMNKFGIAPIVLRTKEAYTCTKNALPLHCSGIETHLFDVLLRPVKETVGLKLLSKMGWKLGQGIGPRTKKSERRKLLKFRKKVYGCKLLKEMEGNQEEKSMFSGSDSESDSDSQYASMTYAPDDYEPFLLSPKHNSFGIGYHGLPKNEISGFAKAGKCYTNFLINERNKKINIVGQAFGVGAFEEEDEDIYARDDLSQYDQALTCDNNKGEEMNANSRKSADVSMPGFHVIDGFTLQSKKCIKRVYQLPEVPKSFRCRHRFKKSRFENVESSNISPLEGCNYLKKADPILGTMQSDQNVVASALVTPNSVKTQNQSQCHLKPFGYDPAKQERFETYLKLDMEKKNENDNYLAISLTSDWQKEKEKMEFSQAAKLLRPLEETLQSRFLPASQADDSTESLAVVDEFLGENEDRRKAAKMKMYGRLTRKIDEWSPCPLLSKRFNVPELQKKSHYEDKKNEFREKSMFSRVESFELSVFEKKAETMEEKLTTKEESEFEKKSDNEKFQEGDNKIRSNKIDLFKAIFLASDDEDGDEAQKISSDSKNELGEYEENFNNQRRNDSPPRGIFQNIDFEVFRKEKESNESFDASSVVDVGFLVDPQQIYGPKIPDAIPPRSISKSKDDSSIINEADNAEWVEKRVHYSSGKKKKRKEKKSRTQKEKHSRSKHKSKHKKHKR